VFFTNELTVTELKTFDKDNGWGLEHALWANDPQNRKNIGLKTNVLEIDLQTPSGYEWVPFRGTLEALKQKVTKGTYHYPVEGLTDPKVKDLWWGVERGYPGALKALVASAAKKSPQQAELQKVLEVVKDSTAKRQDEVVAEAPSMAAYEALESFITDSDGLDTKKAVARLKELKAGKDLKDELKARDIYLQCQALLLSPKPDSQKAGKENMAMLAKKMPNTVYGQKAASIK
jgi:hypothetical protein